MGRVVVPAVDLAGADDAQGSAVLQHGPHLDGRGVGAQQRAVREVERVLHVAGRVPGGHVQAVEVVVLLLLLRTQGHGVAQAHHDLRHLVHGLKHGVKRPRRAAAGGQRHVDAFSRLLRLVLRVAQLAPAGGELLLHLVAEGVQVLSRRGPLLCGELAKGAQERRQGALLAHAAHADLLERLRRGGVGQLPFKGGAHLLHTLHQFVVHNISASSGTPAPFRTAQNEKGPPSCLRRGTPGTAFKKSGPRSPQAAATAYLRADFACPTRERKASMS